MTAGLVCCWLLAGSALLASAAVYLDDAVIDETTNIPTLAFPPWTGLGRVLHLTQSPNGFVVVEVNRIGSTANFEFIHQSIAGAYALCQVSSGEELTYLNVSSKPTLGGFGGGNTLTLNPGQEAYIGYWSQRNGKPVAPPEANDIYGWARVTNTAGNLVLLSSASADTGIIVGTTQAIPEPGPALLTSAASLLLFRRRRKREWEIVNGRPWTAASQGGAPSPRAHADGSRTKGSAVSMTRHANGTSRIVPWMENRGSRMSGSLIFPLPVPNVNPSTLTPFIRWIVSKSGVLLRHRHQPPHEC